MLYMKLSEETRRYVTDLNDARVFAEHVVKFLLAGIQALRDDNQYKPGVT